MANAGTVPMEDGVAVEVCLEGRDDFEPDREVAFEPPFEPVLGSTKLFGIANSP